MTRMDPDNEASFRTCVIKSVLAETQIVKQAIQQELERLQFCSNDIFAIRLALEEALSNAVKHGNQNDSSKTVTVRFAIDDEKAVIYIRDEGCGFCPSSVPDPTTPDRLPLPCGRGLMLMRSYMDVVEYRDEGREVYLVKLRTS